MEGDAQPVASVEERLQGEINQALDELEKVRLRLVTQERDLDTLSQQENEAWQEFERSGEADPDLQAKWSALSDQRHKLAGAVHVTFARIASIERQVRTLSSQDELERRKAVSAKMAHIRKEHGMADEETPTRTKKPTARDRGVPDVYLNEAGNFKIGMDARYKSDLVNAALGIENEAALMTFDPKDAESRLAEREWTGFLDRKRQIVAEKEEKKKAAAEAKEQAAREKAEAKAKEKEEKERSAAEAKAAGQAVPDPKPSGKK